MHHVWYRWNVARYGGGGVHVDAGTLTLMRSTVHGNKYVEHGGSLELPGTADSSSNGNPFGGGGLSIVGPDTNVRLDSVVVSANDAAWYDGTCDCGRYGGGIDIVGARLLITASQLSENRGGYVSAPPLYIGADTCQ